MLPKRLHASPTNVLSNLIPHSQRQLTIRRSTYSTSCIASTSSIHFTSHFPVLHSTDLGPNLDPDAEVQKHLGINRKLDRNRNSHNSASSGILEQSDMSRHQSVGGPDPPPPSGKSKGKKKKVEITDQEWEIRTGRAIYILQQTLPDFFSLGLVSSSIDNGNDSGHSKRKTPAISGSSATTSSSGQDADPTTAYAEERVEPESIYSPKIRLAYTPPVRLPSPFPTTLHVEGLPLYMASSVFIRHTLKTLYSDLHVELKRVSVQTPKSNPGGKASQPPSAGLSGDGREEKEKKIFNKREKSVFIGACVRGKARVSGAVGEWEVNSTYTFSPQTGLIHIHTINSIHPAPHQAVYDALRSSLERVLGLAGAGTGAAEVTRTEEVQVKANDDGDNDGARVRRSSIKV